MSGNVRIYVTIGGRVGERSQAVIGLHRGKGSGTVGEENLIAPQREEVRMYCRFIGERWCSLRGGLYGLILSCIVGRR